MENNTKNSHENYHIISDILVQELKNDKTVFVFPTEITARSWAEKALFLTEQKAVRLDRFIAWDSFKGSAIRSVKQEHESIPSLLRKLFVQNLLESALPSGIELDTKIEAHSETTQKVHSNTNSNINSEANFNEPFFSSLIPPEYADYSPSFSSWIAGLLPQLSRFKSQIEKTAQYNTSVLDNESHDLLKLEKTYSTFLKQNMLFEPAWEKPPFHDDGHFYYVFFPDIASDFDEYKAILEKTENVRVVFSPDKKMVKEKLKVKEFENAREEIRFLSLEIETLIKKNIPYTSIAIHLPEENEISVYVERELSLRNIPFQVRSGKALSLYGAGSFFSAIAGCATDSFSFSSIKTLLSNKSLPWSTTSANLIAKLFDFGIKNNCLCSYEESSTQGNNTKLIDTWLEAFKIVPDEILKTFYTKLKQAILSFSKAKTFSNLRIAYFQFRETFFDMELCTEESDLILSRCISELLSLITLEETYTSLTIQAPLDFFCTHLDTTEYLAQQEISGIHIFPYKTAVAAPFSYNFVINAGQKQLSIVHQPLSFLLHTKKEALEIADSNVTDAYLYLYSLGNVQFSYSKQSFSHYSLPHTRLEKYDIDESKKNRLKQDIFMLEKNIFLNNQHTTSLYPIQKEGFEQWIKAKSFYNRNLSQKNNYIENFILDTNIHTAVIKKVTKSNTTKIKVSATHLKDFFFCPKSFLYKNIYVLENEKLSTELLSPVFLGEIYHAILETFFNFFKENNKTLPRIEGETEKKSCETIIAKSVNTVFSNFPQSVFKGKPISPLTIEIVKNQAKAYEEKITQFMNFFLLSFGAASVLETEVWFEETENDSYYLSGKIDLILKTTNGEIWIIDFKTGYSPTRSASLVNEKGELADFQLPLYVRLYEKVRNQQVRGAAFCSINEPTIYPIIGFIKSIDGKPNPFRTNDRVYRNLELYPEEKKENTIKVDFNKTLEALENYITIFTHKILHNEFALDSEIPFSSCLACDYNKICRTSYTVSGDTLASRALKNIKDRA